MVHLEVRPRHTSAAAAKPASRIPGLAAVLVITAVAVPLGRLVPVVGGPVFGIVLGVIAGLFIQQLRSEACRPGYDFASKTLLQLSIVVLAPTVEQVKVPASVTPLGASSVSENDGVPP